MSHLRDDEAQFLRHSPKEVTSTVRAAEAWALRVAGAHLARQALKRGVSPMIAENMKHIGHLMNEMSDARMEYLGTEKYDTGVEDLVSAGSFNVVGRFLNGEKVDPVVVLKATDVILGSLKHVDMRTRDAGFLHPTRLESILTRGD